MPHSQAFCFNKIYLQNQFYERRCNDLKVWWKHKAYNEKLVGQQILKAGKYRGTTSKMKSIKLCWRLILPIILLRIIILSEESFCSSCNKPRFKTCKLILQTQSLINHITWISLLKMEFTFLVLKPAMKNTREALKNFEVGFIFADVCRRTFWKKIKLSKSRFTLISGKGFTTKNVIGKSC